MADEKRPNGVKDETPLELVLPDLVLGELYVVERNGHRGKVLLVELDGKELEVPDEPTLDGVYEVKSPVVNKSVRKAPAVEKTSQVVEPAPIVEPVVEETPVEPEKEEAPVEEPVIEELPEQVEELDEETAPLEEKEEDEIIPTPVEELNDEEDSEGEEEEESEEGSEAVEKISLKEKYPGKTFEQRLYEAGEVLREQYSEIKNEFLSFRKVKARRTKSCETFRHGYDIIGKVVVAGKGLKVYLALDPLSVDSAIYHQRDASSKKRFAMVPLVVKVRTPLAVRKAKTLIDMACEGKDTQKKARYTIVDYSNPEQQDIEDED